MNKIAIYFTACLLTITSGCSEPPADDEETGKCNPEKTTFIWSANKAVIIYCCDTSYTSQSPDPWVRHFSDVVDGSNIVFGYTYYGPECDYVTDDEWRETLTFEINKNLTEFEYTDAEIAETNCNYTKSCFCTNYGACLISNGVISGKKISRTEWEISVCVIVTYPHHPGIVDFDPKAIDFTSVFTTGK